jgi:hypothetical protein
MNKPRGRPPGSKNKKPATAGKIAATNMKRDLAAIAGDIHALERRNVFEIGGLLIEAKSACEHGAWMQWLEDEFSWSDSTANNYVSAFHLKTKFPTVGNLKIPSRTLYDLADDLDDADLPTLIEALEEASKAKSISVDDAQRVIHLTQLRIEYGNYPQATLFALDLLPGDEWAAQAAASLKTARPETDEEADKIVRAHHKPHVEALFDSSLPDWLFDSGSVVCLEAALDRLKDTAARKEFCRRILQELNATSEPLSVKEVLNIVAFAQGDEADDGGADEPPPRPAPKPPRPEPETQETNPAEAAATAAARADIGPLSASEHERLTRTITDLTNQGNVQRSAIAGRDNEIVRLEDKIKKLQGADLPTLTVSKHIEALVAILKKQSREAQEVAVERLCNALKIDPHKINIEKEAA